MFGVLFVSNCIVFNVKPFDDLFEVGFCHHFHRWPTSIPRGGESQLAKFIQTVNYCSCLMVLYGFVLYVLVSRC